MLSSNSGINRPNSTFKQIADLSRQFKSLQKIEKISNLQLLEDPTQSVVWLVDSDGTKLRKICGHRPAQGTPCLSPAGRGTDHPGFGKCRSHSRSKLFNVVLSRAHNYPTNFLELLEHSSQLESLQLNSLDPEIQMLYTLQNYILTMERDERVHLSIEEIQMLQSLTSDIIKAKTVKAKIQRELKMDSTSIKEFIDQIFGLIAQRVDPAKAKLLFADILNQVIVPFQNKDRIAGDKVSGGIEAQLDKFEEREKRSKRERRQGTDEKW